MPPVLDLIAVEGPWLLFLLAILETCFVTGLLVPSGVATSIAAGIAVETGAPLWPVAAAALAGGAIGDTLGFWVGRFGRERWFSGNNRAARQVRAVQDRAEEFFGRSPFVSVTLARVISFVRTVMPLAAGMSDMSYRRYLPYELLGLVIWCALYIAMGMAAEQGWSLALKAFGPVGAAITVALVVAAWMVVKSRGRARRKRSA